MAGARIKVIRKSDRGVESGRVARNPAARRVQVAALCVVVLTTGAWFLMRGVARNGARMPWLAAWTPIPMHVQWTTFLAAVCGAALVFAAVGLGDGRAWGWLVATLSALAALGFALVLWLGIGIADWVALSLALCSAIALVAPSVREAYLGADDDPA